MKNITNERSVDQLASPRTWTGSCLLASITIAAGITFGCDQPSSRLPDLEDDREEDNCCDDGSCTNEITTVAQLKQCRVVLFTADPEGTEEDEDGEYSEKHRDGHWDHPRSGSATSYHIALSDDQTSAALIEHERSLQNDGGDTVLWRLQDGAWKDTNGFTASARCSVPWGDEEPNRDLQANFCGNTQVDGDEFCDASDPQGLTCESLGFSGGTFSCPSDCSKPTVEDSGCSNLMPTLYQARYDESTKSFPYGQQTIGTLKVTGAPGDTDPERWAMAHDGNFVNNQGTYRLYHMAKGRNDVLYQFSWDGQGYAYERQYDIDFGGNEAEVDTTMFAVTHGHNDSTRRLWFLNKSHDKIMHFYSPWDGTGFRVFNPIHDNQIDTSGVDLSGWAMIDVGFDASPGGDDTASTFFYAWNSSKTEIVEFKLTSTDPDNPALPTGHSYPVTGFPADKLGSDFGMMHEWIGAGLSDDDPKRHEGTPRFYMRGPG